MADKSIGELPVAQQLDDESLLVVEQQGEARSIQGVLVKGYAQASVKVYVDAAAKSAEAAGESEQKAAESAEQAAGSAAEAADSAEKAKDFSGHAPEIRDDTWWVWNVQKQVYEDTGVSARGNVMYATFWVDPATGDLYMFTPDAYDGPGFRLSNGDLEVVLTHA